MDALRGTYEVPGVFFFSNCRILMTSMFSRTCIHFMGSIFSLWKVWLSSIYDIYAYYTFHEIYELHIFLRMQFMCVLSKVASVTNCVKFYEGTHEVPVFFHLCELHDIFPMRTCIDFMHAKKFLNLMNIVESFENISILLILWRLWIWFFF